MKFADFPKEEFVARCQKAKVLMEERELAALFLINDKNCTYFSGYRKPAPYYRTFLILPRDDDPTLILPNGQRGNAEETSWLYPDHVVVYGRMHGHKLPGPLELLVKVIKKSGLEDKNVGTELAQVPVDLAFTDSETLRHEFPNLKFSDASGLMWEMRMLKSRREIGNIRKSCKITCKAFKAGLESVHAGITEAELSGIVRSEAIKQGADDCLIVIRSGQERYKVRDPYPRDKRLKRGDIVTIDGGSVYKGYFSDIYRIACVGDPSPKQAELYKTVFKAEKIAIEALEPSAKVEDVMRNALKITREAGYADYDIFSPWMGHGLGLDIHEPPDFQLGSESILQAGMVVAVEPSIYPIEVVEWYRTPIPTAGKSAGEGVFSVEDNVLITEKGHEVLTPLDRALWIVK